MFPTFPDIWPMCFFTLPKSSMNFVLIIAIAEECSVWVSEVLHDFHSKCPNPLIFSNPSLRTFLGMGTKERMSGRLLHPKGKAQELATWVWIMFWLLQPNNTSMRCVRVGIRRNDKNRYFLNCYPDITLNMPKTRSICWWPGWAEFPCCQVTELQIHLSSVYPLINMSQLVPSNAALIVMASQKRRWWRILYPVCTFYSHIALSGVLSLYSSQSALRTIKCCHSEILIPDLVLEMIWCWYWGSQSNLLTNVFSFWICVSW